MAKLKPGSLQRYCEKEGISMKELAKRTGISYAQLHLLNRFPRYNITVDTAEKLWKTTGLPLEYYSERRVNKK